MDIDRAVGETLAEARRRWPAVRVDEATFTAYLRERLDGTGPAAVQLVDLLLACACAQGQTAAIAAFEQAHLPGVRAGLRRLRLEEAAIDDVVSRMREELFIGRPDARPRITQYEGRSSLQAWLQVVANRMALRLVRRERRIEATEAAAQDALAVGIADPELARLKVAYRDVFRKAFLDAAAALSSRDRNLIRYHYVDRLTGDEIAAIYRVNRSTVVRWLRQAYDTLLAGTQERLAAGAAVDRRDFDSITRLVQSQLDFSIRELLGGAESSPEMKLRATSPREVSS